MSGARDNAVGFVALRQSDPAPGGRPGSFASRNAPGRSLRTALRGATARSASRSTARQVGGRFVALLFLAFTLHTHAQSAITRDAIAGGGGVSTGGVYAIDTTVGQAEAKRRQVSSGYALAGGLRANAMALPPARIPQGLVAWWRGEENTLDTLGAHHGFISNGVSYAPSHVAIGFDFNGTAHQKIRVPGSVALDVGSGEGFTIEGWIRPNSFDPQTIAEWSNGSTSSIAGASFAHSSLGGGPGGLLADLHDTNGLNRLFLSPANILSTNVFQHVGLTYERSSGMARFFLNGSLVNSSNLGVFTPPTSQDFYLGGIRLPAGSFNGRMDEMSLYNRALTANEMAAIAAAGVAGKSTLHPHFLTKPVLPEAISDTGYTQHLATVLGVAPVMFAMESGNLPAGLTLSSVGTISGVPVADGSFTFAVRATDAVSLSTTQFFTLPVLGRLTPPPGLVSWWRAESNSLDSISSNHGTNLNGTTYTNAVIGTAFHLDGVNDRVSIPDAPSLRPASMTIEGWVRYNAVGSIRVFASRTVGSGVFNSFTIYAVNGVLRGFIGNASGQASVAAIPTFALTSGRWYHLAFTFDETTAMQTLYVDGTNAASALADRPIGYDTNAIILGAEFNNGVYESHFSGALDEVSFYNRALAPEEIAALRARDLRGKAFSGPYFTTVPELPFARVSRSYTQQLATTRGTAPVTNTLLAGTLPPGLSLSEAGWITGVPSDAGTFALTVRATDANGLTGDQIFTLRVESLLSPPPGIISWWRAESNSLDSIGGNHGTNLNGTTYTNAMLGSAFHFDGVNDRVSVPDHPSLHPTSLTVEGWVRYNATNGIRAIAGKTVGNGDANSFTFYSFNGVLRGGVGNASGSSSVFAIDTLALTTGRWYHVAFTFDEATAMQSIYVDGTNTVSMMADRPTGYDTNAINLGMELNSGAYVWAFSGALDEFSFYNRALAPAEIAVLHARSLRGKTTNGPYFTTVPELPFARVGHSYAQQLVTTRGAAPVTNMLVAGTPPPGLDLGESGWITGVPTNTGTFTFTVRATDSNGLTGEQPFSLAVLPADPRSTNLVAWWRAEDNALDAIGTNHGTLVNGMTYFAGVAGRAFRLDGTNDYMRVADSPALRPTSLTVEGWVRYFRTDGTRTFINKPVGAGPTTNRSFTIYSHDGVLRGFVGNAGGNSTVIASNHFALTSNRWYHLAFTYDGTTGLQTLYVDGAFATNAVANQPIGYDTNTVTVGMQYYAGFNTWYFSGIQDEVALYNRALTANEIASIYNAGAAGKNVPPIANADTFTNVATALLKIPKAGLLANDTDADGDTLTFSSLPLLTTNGVTMITNSTFLFYTNGANVADQFSYVISDGFGGSATGTVSIVVLTNVTGQITGQLTVSNNVATAYFAGRPGWTYTVQRSTNLLNWTNIWTTNTPAGGLFQFTDDFNDLGAPPPAAYYRLRWAP